ncbi:MAG: hypothetical protein IPM57_05650, partial [Oligoflexia bacterium]|nr:hypothetical protein [Oligoflexia bacterium]
MKKYSLTKNILVSSLQDEGVLLHADNSISKGFEVELLSSGLLEEDLTGPTSDNFFAKLSDLLTKLPNNFEGQIILNRKRVHGSEIPGFFSKLYFFEKVKKAEGYSHLSALLSELSMKPVALNKESWNELISGYFGPSVIEGIYPDVIWEKDAIKIKDKFVRVLSLTELPQLTWKGCLQPILKVLTNLLFLSKFLYQIEQRL